MKLTRSGIAALGGVCLIATAAVPRALGANAETKAVLAPIEAMFAGMSARNEAAILRPTVPGGTLTLMRAGKAVQMTFAEFAARVSRPGKEAIEERIHDPLIRVDHDLAVVWAPFDLYIDGKVSHCGTDLFSLVHQSGVWRIASIADTSRNDCLAK